GESVVFQFAQVDHLAGRVLDALADLAATLEIAKVRVVMTEESVGVRRVDAEGPAELVREPLVELSFARALASRVQVELGNALGLPVVADGPQVNDGVNVGPLAGQQFLAVFLIERVRADSFAVQPLDDAVR